MRSWTNRRPARHTEVEPVGADRPPRVSRAMRGAAHGALLLTLVVTTGAYSAASPPEEPAPVTETEPPADETAFFAEAETARFEALPRAASRTVERAALPRAVLVAVDGDERTVLTEADSVAEVLAAADVGLGADDEVSVPLTAFPVDGARIEVARVTFVDGTERTEIDYDTTERDDPDLLRGKREVETEGEPGEETVAYRARVVDGVEVSREVLVRSVVEPEDRVVRVGTKAPPPPPPPPAPAPAPAPARASSSTPAPVYQGDPRSIGRAMAAARGWGGSQWVCLERLWTRESNWNPYARNPSSGAYGIPQSLPASKMATAGADYLTNPRTQISWGLGYIGARYGTPCGAWAHSQAVNWY